jgi:hypothetical protein
VLDEARITADWSKDEDQLLLEKYDEMNGKFAKVLLWLPGRSYNDCQRRFLVLHPGKAPKRKNPICTHNVPRRRCKICNGFDVCVHRVTRANCNKCRGALWCRAIIAKRLTFVKKNPANKLLALVNVIVSK